jgi:DNA-binding CsgD family transcriptional regulator
MGVRWSRMSWAEKNELWQRWRRGESLRQIAGALHRRSSSIYEYVGAEGGIAPRQRQRSRLALTTTEREEISRQLARGDSIRAIGRVLGRAPSTISREVAQNHGRAEYRAAAADRHAWRRTQRPKPVDSLCDQHSGVSWRRSSPCSGPLSKSQAGFEVHFRTILRCRCPTRRFIGVCSFKAAAF